MNRAASAIDRPESFMKVCGSSSQIRSPSSMPSASLPWKRCRQGPKACRLAIRSTAMNPTLCRFLA